MSAATEAQAFVDKINTIILFPTIALLTGIAFLVFIWGAFQYFMHADNDQAREAGAKHIMYGIIGLVVMVSAYTILTIAAGTGGLNQELDCATEWVAGCDAVFEVSTL